jgi:hypothetical protein
MSSEDRGSPTAGKEKRWSIECSPSEEEAKYLTSSVPEDEPVKEEEDKCQ